MQHTSEKTINGNLVTASIHDNGAVLFHTPSGRIFASNATGARIWQALDQAIPADQIADTISRDYRIDHAIALEHTVRFVAELERFGLLARGR